MIKEIIVFDDNLYARSSLRLWLSESNYNILADINDIQTLSSHLLKRQADLLIFEPVNFSYNMIASIANLKETFKKMRIMAFSLSDSYYHIRQCKQAGVDSYLCKTASKELILSSIELISNNINFFPQRLNTPNQQDYTDSTILESFSSNEIIALRHFSLGDNNISLTNKNAPDEQRKNAQLARIIKKMNQSSKMEIVNIARRNHIF